MPLIWNWFDVAIMIFDLPCSLFTHICYTHAHIFFFGKQFFGQSNHYLLPRCSQCCHTWLTSSSSPSSCVHAEESGTRATTKRNDESIFMSSNRSNLWMFVWQPSASSCQSVRHEHRRPWSTARAERNRTSGVDAESKRINCRCTHIDLTKFEKRMFAPNAKRQR